MRENKILVVDDEKDIRSAFEKAFTRAGFAVTTAATAEEALEIFKKETHWVIFSDLNLPGMTGVELCRKITTRQRMVTAFAVTGYASLFELSDCREAGFEDYFVKPVDLEDLTDAAHRAFKRLERWRKRPVAKG
jgi:DNA-binding NtrC family response regulator